MKQFLNSLKVSHQIILIAAIFTVPMALAAFYFVAAGINKDIDTARLELQGDAFQRPLETLLWKISDHGRLVRRRLAGESAVSADIDATEREIDNAWKELDDVAARYGTALQYTPEGLAKRQRQHVAIATVKGEWQNALGAKTDQDVVQQHRHLGDDLRMMITHIGDTSGLILDPDLDSYYLMDATLCALPQTQDRLTDLLTDAAALTNRDLTPDERVHFAVIRAMLDADDLQRISGDVDTSLKEDSGFNGTSVTLQKRLPDARKAYAEPTQALLALLQKMQDSNKSRTPQRCGMRHSLLARPASPSGQFR